MRSADLLGWISDNQPGAKCEFAHGWWNFAEFLQLLSNDFASFDFGVLTSYSMETPPPTTLITMPVVSARSQKLEIYFKESWVVEPNYTVTVKTQSPASFILLDILQPIDPKEKWLLKDFPSDCVYPPYCEGVYAFSGSVKNQHLLYALFHVLSHQATTDELKLFERLHSHGRCPDRDHNRSGDQRANPTILEHRPGETA